MAREMRLLLDNLLFGEGPRWRRASDTDPHGWLYYSDFHRHCVRRVNEAGADELVLEIDDQPSGLGWLPDGRMLIVAMRARALLVFDGKEAKPYADLSALADFHCNDMVVDEKGNAYVGNFGWDIYDRTQEMRAAKLILVRPDNGGGKAEIAADDLLFPNGAVISADGKRLIIGETFGNRLTAFDIGADARLSNRRVWADLSKIKPDYNPVPDGIALDGEGAIWVASPTTNEVIRVREGGEVLETIALDRSGIACMLGGADGKTLFILTAKDTAPEKIIGAPPQAQLQSVRVDVAHAGLP